MPAAPPPDPVRSRRRAYRGISAGVALICVGVVLLLNTLGYVGWGVWFELLRLWPILLISIGLRWIFVNTPAHGLCLAGPLLIALTTFWVVSTYRGPGPFPRGDLRDAETLEFDCPAPAE